MNPFRISFFVGTLLSLLFLAVATIDGQTSRGTLTGTITDSGGAISGRAAATVTQRCTNAVRQTPTHDTRHYPPSPSRLRTHPPFTSPTNLSPPTPSLDT